MNKILFISLSFFLISFSAYAADSEGVNQFEQELRLLEDNSLNHSMKQVEALKTPDAETNFVTDDVSVGNAATLRESSINRSPAIVPDEMDTPAPTTRTRRIRSR